MTKDKSLTNAHTNTLPASIMDDNDASPTVETSPTGEPPFHYLGPARSSWCPLNRHQLGNLGYFFIYGGYSLMGAFASVLYESKGFSATWIGLLMALPPLSAVTVLPAVSYLAETRNAQVFFITCGVAMSGLMVFFLCASTEDWVVVSAAIAYNVYFAPVMPFWDEHCMAILGPEHRSKWGAMRSFGAYGWGCSAILTSYLFGSFGFVTALSVFVIGYGVTLWCLYETPAQRQAGDHHFRDVVKYVWHRGDILNWCFGMSAMGFGYSLIGSFLFVYLTSLGAPSELLGICLVFTVIIEIPLFQCSTWMHAHFSDSTMFLMAVVGWVARVVGYSLLTDPWYVLFLEPFHGFSFGLMWMAGVHVFAAEFPKELSNSAFGVLGACTWGIGPLIGNVIGGSAYDALGPRLMFRCAAALMLVMGTLFYLFDRVSRRRTVMSPKSDVMSKEITAME